MEMRQLRYFLAIAQHRTFTRAAEAVHISQPSLSVQIMALEDELGTPLFDRLGRQVALTGAGRILFDHAERVVRELDQAAALIRELSGAHSGTLAVGTLSTVNSYLMPPLVCQFKERFPNVHLRIEASPSSDIEEQLAANRLDLGLCLLPVAHDHLVSTRLFDETLVLVAPSDMPLPSRRMRMRELAKLPLVLMPADYCLRKMIEAECAEAGIRPQVSVEMSSPEGILEAVKQGAGLTILPELYVRHRLRGAALRTIQLYDPIPRHAVGLVHLANRHLGLAAQEFGRMCRTTLSDLRLPSDAAGGEGETASVKRVAG